jgi:hypothetical protein
MKFEEIYKLAQKEAEWLRYYGHTDTRNADSFEDEKFYDRIISIGYTKRVIPLSNRCAMDYISGNSNVMGLEADEITSVSGPRNHEKNIYTPLEYIIGTKKEGYEELIKIIKN